jgi:hypothetical protein
VSFAFPDQFTSRLRLRRKLAKAGRTKPVIMRCATRLSSSLARTQAAPSSAISLPNCYSLVLISFSTSEMSRVVMLGLWS